MPGPVFGPEPLSPTLFLDRSALVFGDRAAVIDGERTFTYAELHDRCLRLAGALRAAGVGPGDRVSTLVPNTHVALEAHFGVAWAGAALNALNTRLADAELAWIVGHAGSRILICDHSLADMGEVIVAAVGPSGRTGPLRPSRATTTSSASPPPNRYGTRSPTSGGC